LSQQRIPKEGLVTSVKSPTVLPKKRTKVTTKKDKKRTENKKINLKKWCRHIWERF